MDRLANQMAEAGILLAEGELVGHVIRFWDAKDALVTIVTAVRTTDDGLPFVEVSARKFAGFEISGIVLKADEKAELLTTDLDTHYRHMHGRYEL